MEAEDEQFANGAAQPIDIYDFETVAPLEPMQPAVEQPGSWEQASMGDAMDGVIYEAEAAAEAAATAADAAAAGGDDTSAAATADAAAAPAATDAAAQLASPPAAAAQARNCRTACHVTPITLFLSLTCITHNLSLLSLTLSTFR